MRIARYVPRKLYGAILYLAALGSLYIVYSSMQDSTGQKTLALNEGINPKFAGMFFTCF